MPRFVLLSFVALVVTSVLSSRANAHPEWSPVQVNRYFKLVLGEKNRIVYTVLYGDAPALPERRAADANHDGKLDVHERELLGARILAHVSAGLHIAIDGTPWALPPPLVDVGLAGDDVAPEPFSVDLTYPLALDGDHALLVDDRVEVVNEGDSEVAAEVSSPATLLDAHRGRTGSGRDRVFSFRGPRFSLLEDRSVSLRFQTRPPALASRLRGRWRNGYGWGFGIAAVVLAALTALRSRYRNMKG